MVLPVPGPGFRGHSGPVLAASPVQTGPKPVPKCPAVSTGPVFGPFALGLRAKDGPKPAAKARSGGRTHH